MTTSTGNDDTGVRQPKPLFRRLLTGSRKRAPIPGDRRHLHLTDRSTIIELMDMIVDTRQRLLNSARDLIYARSYADVGVQAICEHAGVKKGSFYHFFPSKRDLTLAVLDVYFVEFKQDLMNRAFAPDLPPMARFGRLIELAFGFQNEISRATGHVLGCPFGNLAVELSTQDEHIREKLAGIFVKLQENFEKTLDEAVAAGEVADIDTKATAEAMFAYIEGLMLMAKTRNDPEVIRTLGPALADIRIPARG